VSFARGWDPLRADDFGPPWEHVVLEHLQARFPDTRVQYWRDKSGRELDFVLATARDAVDTVECKWGPGEFDPKGLATFRRYYPEGRNVLVTPSAVTPYTRRVGTAEILVCSPGQLVP